MAQRLFPLDQNGWEVRPTDDLEYDVAYKERPHTPESWNWYCGLTAVTNENWGGTFEGGKLRVNTYKSHDGTYNVVVSGNDDFAMYYRDIPHEQALGQVLKRIPAVVDRMTLLGIGFGND